MTKPLNLEGLDDVRACGVRSCALVPGPSSCRASHRSTGRRSHPRRLFERERPRRPAGPRRTVEAAVHRLTTAAQPSKICSSVRTRSSPQRQMSTWLRDEQATAGDGLDHQPLDAGHTSSESHGLGAAGPDRRGRRPAVRRRCSSEKLQRPRSHLSVTDLGGQRLAAPGPDLVLPRGHRAGNGQAAR